MNALEVCVLGIITSLNQGLETSLHQGSYTAAEYALLTEQVGLSLTLECGVKNTGSGAADTSSICKTDVVSSAGSVLIYCDKAGNASADLVLGTYSVTRALRSDHDNVNVSRRNDLTEVDIEAVCESKGLACGEVRSDAFLIKISLSLIVDEDHDEICLLSSLSGCVNLKACVLSLLPALGAFVQTDNDINAALLEVQSVCVTLAAVADDSNGLAVEQGQVAVFLMINLCHCFVSPFEEYYTTPCERGYTNLNPYGGFALLHGNGAGADHFLDAVGTQQLLVCVEILLRVGKLDRH